MISYYYYFLFLTESLFSTWLSSNEDNHGKWHSVRNSIISVQEKNPRGTFRLCHKFVNQGVLKNPIKGWKAKVPVLPWKFWSVAWSLLKVFWLITNMLTEPAMFDLQLLISRSCKLCNQICYQASKVIRVFEIHWHISAL